VAKRPGGPGARAHRPPGQPDRAGSRVPEDDGLEAERLAGLENRAVGRYDEALGAPVDTVEERVFGQGATEGLLDLAGGLLEDPREDVLLPVGDGAWSVGMNGVDDGGNGETRVDVVLE
jgi:hypothetical protein